MHVFVINNALEHDNRIPPFGMDRDEAEMRNTPPVPATQYGNPGSGEVCDHWSDVPIPIPSGAVTSEVRLYYQQTSWEYTQFLWLANDGLGDVLPITGQLKSGLLPAPEGGAQPCRGARFRTFGLRNCERTSLADYVPLRDSMNAFWVGLPGWMK